jgi:glyoxalase family protein
VGWVQFWLHRFVENGIPHKAGEMPFGESMLAFQDPDGLRLALVAMPGIDAEPAWSGNVPAEYAIRGFHSVSLLVREAAPTGGILTDVFGFPK